MTTYGLTSAGFREKRQDEILTSLQESLWADLGAHLNLDPDSLLGQILGVESIQLADVWALGLTMYNALDVDAAEGTLLENLCSLVGVERQGATKLQLEVTCAGTNGTVIPAGSIVRVENGARFLTTEDATISGGSVDVVVEAEDAGELTVGANTVTQIVTAILGWNTVTNASAATGGSDVETDLELRIRRRLSLQVGGAGTEGAIRAAVLGNEDVQACAVVSNRSMVTVGGRPPKSFEVVVWPTGLSTLTRDDIAERIYRTMPAGIESHGTLVYTITDARGYSQTVKFSYATQVAVAVAVTVTTTTGWPSNGVDLVEAAVEAVFDGLSIGDDAPYPEIYSAVYNACAGIYDVDLLLNGGSDPIAVDDDEVAVLTPFGAGSSVTVV